MNSLITPDSPDTVCSFTGYRPEKMPHGGDESTPYIQEVKLTLRQSIATAYEYGFRHFLSGMAKGFDLWAAEAVLTLQDEGFDIDLWAALPYPAMDHRGDPEWHERFVFALSHAAWVGSVASHYSLGCYQERDRFLIRASSAVISYFDGVPGGTEYTIRYAQKLGRCGINLGDIEAEYLPHITEVRLKSLHTAKKPHPVLQARRKSKSPRISNKLEASNNTRFLYLNRTYNI